MKIIFATLVLMASMTAFANPAIDAAAMEQDMLQHPDRRAVGASTILGLENHIPDTGLISVTLPAAVDGNVESYPGRDLPIVDEGYPVKE